jgi:hypothetical protein
MMIRQASYTDNAVLRDIWGAAFHEDTAFNAFISDHCLNLGTVYCTPRELPAWLFFPFFLRAGSQRIQEGRMYMGGHSSLMQKKRYSSLLLEQISVLFPFLLVFPASSHYLPSIKHADSARLYIPWRQILPKIRFAGSGKVSLLPPSAAGFWKCFCMAGRNVSFACDECLFRGGSLVRTD